MATRYHILPSDVLRKADTLDMLVMDVASSWHHQQTEKARAEAEGRPMKSDHIPASKLKEMIEQVKKKNVN